MQVIEMPKTVYVQLNVDDRNIGVDPDGNYYRVENGQFTPIQPMDVVMEYLGAGLRLPDQFIGARELVQRLL